jgi:hypothetical protein
MNDSELIALVALVNQETNMMTWENQDRLRNNFALAYTGYGDYFLLLETELKRRGVITC